MGRWGSAFLVACAVCAAGLAPAAATTLTPLQFMQRFIGDPVDAVRNALRPLKPKALRPADTPLLAVPLPHLRPADGDAATALSFMPNAAAETIVVPTDALPMPLPRVRPAEGASSRAAVAALPAPIAPLTPLPKLVRPPPAAQSTCGVSLARLGVVATPLAPIEEGECGIAAPVAVASLDGGRIDLSTKAIVDCHLAERLATWVKDTLAPKVRKAYGGELTGLRIAASYACRTRDGLPDAKLSEHGHGNAIDISAFRVGKRWIEVGPGWTGGGEDAAFLADARKSACGPFTTVLGPGSDEFHSDHFHLDMIERRTAGPSKGLYCE
jgi:hypothetical protein